MLFGIGLLLLVFGAVPWLSAASASASASSSSSSSTVSAAISGAGPPLPLVALDAFGPHSIRVRFAPFGSSLVDAPIRALLPEAPVITEYDHVDPEHTSHTHPSSHPHTAVSVSGYGELSLTNGNLHIDINEQGLLTATRVSDQVIVLKQTHITFGTPIIQGVGVSPSSISSIVTFAGTSGEAIYGLGEHRNGKLNQMGYQGDTRNATYYPQSHGADVLIPYYSSSLGYGFLFNSASHFNVSITEESIEWGMHAAANMDIWITTTPTTPNKQQSIYKLLLQHLAIATGKSTAMPYYSTGFWQCKLRYRSQDEVLSVAREYVARNLPISVIVVDFMHWDNFGDWSFDRECWPAVGDMVSELSSLGIELAVSFWPFVSVGATHYDEFMVNHTWIWTDRHSNGTKPQPLQLEDSGQEPLYVVDQTEAVVRKAVFDAYWQGYGQYGIRTVWLDAAEPERGTWYNYGNFSTVSHGTDIEMGMSWTRFHAQSFYDGFLSHGYSNNEFFTLSRSTWLGQGQYQNSIWSGDTDSTFEELYTQIRIAQAVGLSGVVLWTSDIGGFCCGSSSDPYFQQLIVRWMQFGAFCPLFRLHGDRQNAPPTNQCGYTGGDNEIWNLAADQVHYDAMVVMMRLREQLRPYIMSLSELAHTTGVPMIRPLFMEFPWDPETYSHDGIYMFGPDWLVSPITVYNLTITTVYLPKFQNNDQAHAEWVYFFQPNQTFQGGQYVFLETPIQEFPLFYIRYHHTKTHTETETSNGVEVD